MRVVDVHNHYYPPRYMAALRSGESAVTVKIDADGNPELHYPGDYNTAVPGHRDIAYRQAVLEKEGVTTQIVSLTTPGTHVETPARAVKYAKERGTAPETIEANRRLFQRATTWSEAMSPNIKN